MPDRTAHTGKAPEPEEIEITPNMIEAGLDALISWQDGDTPACADCIRDVYCAMVRAWFRGGGKNRRLVSPSG